MCLSDYELFALALIPLAQLARLCLLLTLPEGRASLRFDLRAAAKWLPKFLLHTIVAAALIKLVADWFGFGQRMICMDRMAFLLGTALLCAALELGGVAPQQAEPDLGLDIETRYPLRIWSIRILLAVFWTGLLAFVPFR